MLPAPCPLHTETRPPYATDKPRNAIILYFLKQILYRGMVFSCTCLSGRCVMGCNSVTALFFVALSLAKRRGASLNGIPSVSWPLIRPKCSHAAEIEMGGGQDGQVQKEAMRGIQEFDTAFLTFAA